MNKWILTTILSISSIIVGNEEQVIEIDRFEKNELQKFIEGGIPDTVLKVSEGSVIPLDLFVTGELLEVTKKSCTFINVQKTLYFKALSKEQLLISLDNENFVPIQAFLTGVVNAGLIEEDNGQVTFRIDCDLNQRK